MILALELKQLMQHLSVLVSHDPHVGIELDILCCEPVDFVTQVQYLILLVLLRGDEDVHLQLHPVEVVHKLCHGLLVEGLIFQLFGSLERSVSVHEGRLVWHRGWLL